MRTNKVLNLDNQDLQNLKTRFLNSSGFKQDRSIPNITIVSDRSEYRGTTLVGLSFPMRIENGSLAISKNEDRIREQILELLQTFIGERVYRQFFGTPNLVFESISESLNEAFIVRQLTNAIRVPEISYQVTVQTLSEEQVVVFVTYQIANKAPQTLRYVVV